MSEAGIRQEDSIAPYGQVAPDPGTLHLSPEGEAFGNWFAGFADGEGSFQIAKNGNSYSPRFVITVREDDRPVLEEIHKRLAVGQVSRHYTPGMQVAERLPQARFQVAQRGECLKLVHLFDRCPLRAKKAKDYEIWREAVHEALSDLRDPERMQRLKDQLEEGRRFDPDPEDLEPLTPPPALFEVPNV